jgi:hypothetical protein
LIKCNKTLLRHTIGYIYLFCERKDRKNVHLFALTLTQELPF